MFFFLTSAAVRTQAAANPAQAAAHPDEIAAAEAIPASAERVIIRRRTGQDLTELHRKLGTRSRKLLRHARKASAPDLEVIEVPRGQQARVLAALRQSGRVEYAEPDFILKVQGTEPNDFRFWDGSQWSLKNRGSNGGQVGADIDAPSAWDLRTSGGGIVIAVIDTGIRYTHEDLRGAMWHNPGESGLDASGRDRATNNVDDDGNGYVDDVHGINALTNSGNPMDDYGHGTHVAAIIGATGNNNVGIAGVAWSGVRLVALKSLDASGIGTISSAIECMDYARAKGAKIINASWGDYGFTSQALRDASASLRDAGIIFVAACGNSGGDNDANPLYPASYEYDNIIAVAASTRTDTAAAFSNWGRTTVDLAAPGSPIFSAWNGSDSDYRYLDGTSQAAPHVAGAAALIWAQAPTLTYRQVIRAILDHTDPLPAFAGKTVTGGRLNLAQSLAAVVLSTDSFPPVVAMLRPRLNDTVRGAVTIAASASDNVGVIGVQFTLDGHNIGPEITAAPYTYTWNTTAVANGIHVVGAIARDAAGNRGLALPGSTTVAN